MKIIEPGSLPQDEVRVEVCSHCKTKFSFKVSESRESSDERDRGVRIVTCPLPGCNHKVYFYAARG